MNKNDFEELDDEIVSSDELMEEQSNDVPSNSNNRVFGSNINNLRDYEKNNQGTIERLNNAKNKNRSVGLGKEIGNKIAGRSEEEKSGVEKAGDQVAGKVAGTAITAATGGAVGGELANQVGDAAVQVAKKYISNKIKIYVFVGVAIMSLILIIILAMNADDMDEKESKNVNNYVTGNMSEDELYDYLQRMGICPDKANIAGDLSEIDDRIDNDEEDLKGNDEYDINAVCKYAISYFKRIKKKYNTFKTACPVGITVPKDINFPCEVELNIPLFHETLSYGKAYNELWSQKDTPNQKKDIDDLSNAMVEYVHEYCYVNVGIYKNKYGQEVTGSCEGCTYVRPWYENTEWFYFQLSFDKYVSFLKYGTTSTHPYYTKENNGEVEFGSKEKNHSVNNQTGLYDHECVGPSHSTFTNNNSSNGSSNSSASGSINKSSSNYCSNEHCKSYSGTAHTECVKGCKNLQDTCKNNTCKGISSSIDYTKCMNTCVK